ncbi:MAG TPA: hypothetical protein VMF06_19040 [Candidatus Limnocylindria bacterium]|nr:hypothetical protein [Candidatus Limnocylindria bacterium]
MNRPSQRRRSRYACVLTIICLAWLWVGPHAWAADNWIDVSGALIGRLTNSGAKLAWPGGCSGVAVNRLNGTVTIKVVGGGLWRSSDKGTNWQRIDNDAISGRDETGWATSVDANNPTRMGSFSLDGRAGLFDGVAWKPFTTLGRNWDFGSVDWSAPVPSTIIAAKHETDPPGEVYLTQDCGATWKQLSIHLSDKRDRLSMLGALDSATFVYCKGEGIQLSKDFGTTWTVVSAENPQTRVPVFFRGAHYLGDAKGLLVSPDKGVTWKRQGSSVNIWLGPFFGRKETEMVVVGENGAYKTGDAGTTWAKIGDLRPNGPGFSFKPNWFGCYAWDPINNILYASAMGNPAYKLEL